MKKSKGIEIVCTLNTNVTAKQTKIIAKAIEAAMKEAYPGETVRGLWVHESVGNIR